LCLFLSGLVLLLLSGARAEAALVDSWTTDGLSLLDDGDTVGTWTSAANRVASSAVGLEPILRKNATPSGKAVLHFDHDWMSVPNSPVAGLSAFSLAVVFKVDQPGADDGSGWSTKSGIVDANESAVTNDWGFAVRDTGYVCFGTSSSSTGDRTVYLDDQPTYPSVVDGKFHVVVCTWGGGTEIMYMDRYPSKSMSAPTTARNNAGMSFGAIQTGVANRRFVGDLAEIQFFNTALTAVEASNVIAQLSDKYLTNYRPSVLTFASGTNWIYSGRSTTLAWSVSNATSVTIDNGIGPVSPTAGSVQISPTFTTTYTLTAINANGTTSAQSTITVDLGLPVANAQAVTLFKNTQANLVLTGIDPQGAPLTFIHSVISNAA
jgi:hypothetical protein